MGKGTQTHALKHNPVDIILPKAPFFGTVLEARTVASHIIRVPISEMGGKELLQLTEIAELN